MYLNGYILAEFIGGTRDKRKTFYVNMKLQNQSGGAQKKSDCKP